MPFAEISKHNVKKFGEVFTPPGVVFEMILQDGIRPMLQDVDKTILDPATGHGQFPCSELVWKMFYNIDRLDEETTLRALNSLFAIDLQPQSVNIAKNHLKATLADSFKFFTGKDFPMSDLEPLIDNILDKNFFTGDAIKIMNGWLNPQQSLF